MELGYYPILVRLGNSVAEQECLLKSIRETENQLRETQLEAEGLIENVTSSSWRIGELVGRAREAQQRFDTANEAVRQHQGAIKTMEKLTDLSVTKRRQDGPTSIASGGQVSLAHADPIQERMIRSLSNDMDRLNMETRNALEEVAMANEERSSAELRQQLNKRRVLILERHIREIAASILDMKALFSPIIRVPHVILLRIFAIALPYETIFQASHPEVIGHGCEALKLSAVCRVWRSIAFSEPSFWSKLTIRISPAGITPCTRYVDEHFRRARDRMTDITFTIRSIAKVSPALRKSLRRIGHVENLKIHMARGTATYLRRMLPAFPSCRNISLVIPTDWSSESSSVTVRHWTPLLANMERLQCINVFPNLERNPPKLTELSLSMDILSPTALAPMMTTVCDTLRELVLLPSQFGPGAHWSMPIFLPKLAYIRGSIATLHNITSWGMNMPFLRKVELWDHNTHNTRERWQRLSRGALRYSTTVYELSIFGCMEGSQEYIPLFLEGFTSLRKLAIYKDAVHRLLPVFTALSRAETRESNEGGQHMDNIFLPGLQSLEVANYEGPGEVVHEFLVARRQLRRSLLDGSSGAPTSISLVTLTQCTGITENTRSMIMEETERKT